ncbi:MAG TPA: hypothetical protein IAC83_05675 [Euryarchaeota archaeon]|nr:hypothetical protein [Euryarchaeota archaeon]
MVDLSPIMWTSLAYNLLEVEGGYRRETIHSLSDPGRRIAEHLDAICEILDEIRPGMNDDGTVHTDPNADGFMDRFRNDSDTSSK